MLKERTGVNKYSSVNLLQKALKNTENTWSALSVVVGSVGVAPCFVNGNVWSHVVVEESDPEYVDVFQTNLLLTRNPGCD